MTQSQTLSVKSLDIEQKRELYKSCMEKALNVELLDYNCSCIHLYVLLSPYLFIFWFVCTLR